MKLAPALLLFVIVGQAAAGESQPLMLDFHADWCGPCRQMRPAVDALVAKGYPVKSVDIDKSPKLAAKYKVDGVPTFIVVDENGGEIARTSGAQPVKQLAQFYLDAREQAVAHSGDRGDADADADEEPAADEAEEAPAAEADQSEDALTEEEIADRARQKPVNPKPWETVVRIKVYNGNSVGFGSGTVIYSSQEESIILTCAHIFKVDGERKIPPAKFTNKIGIDLFNGRIKVVDGKAQLSCVEEGIPGKAIDYDFASDVGLIRIRRGNLPYAHVVPSHWTPLVRMSMTTVGCSEGHDATAWSTKITRSPSRMFPKNPEHLALECEFAPLQGRSGGGLFTDDGFVAGVCNFAEPQGDKGLYAAPESIYKMLNRNKLADLYAPPSLGGSNTLLASNSAGRRAAAGTVRGQSPDRDEAPRKPVRPGQVTIPGPEMLLADEDLPSRSNSRRPQVQPASNKVGDRRLAWSPTRSADPSPRSMDDNVVQQTDLDLDPAVDNSRFEPPAYEDDEPVDSRVNDEDVVAPRKESRKPTRNAPVRSSSEGWRPAGSGR
ncbi:thioredoxin domain-containing protein [Paludisphaera rhizosphaerae]|uniref:thioredoxin domain-containing protein n=1 Tax=Paludisphaera rhizosphaerae TaxID=2711216 RepID=UPI0013EDEE79|nr:thioredoxin domain-containing protein [Paludisphaera rhizosphaerae]